MLPNLICLLTLLFSLSSPALEKNADFRRLWECGGFRERREGWRLLQPPPGTPIQRGIVPGGQFGGVGGVPEVIFPKGF